MDAPTPEEELWSDALEEEVQGMCQGSLHSLGSAEEELHGEVLAARALTWDRLVQEASLSTEYKTLTEAVLGESVEWPKDIRNIRQYKESLAVIEGVVVYKGRPVIPVAFHQKVLDTLHSGHQGVTSMYARSSASVWWPGMYDDVMRIRATCRRCDSNAPSQPKETPMPQPRVEYPFQQICSDYFTCEGRQYLVMVDRYSGWPSVYKAKTADDRELIRLLRRHCETFGAPEEIATDGGSVYVSHSTQSFLSVWGIMHRLSLAYYLHSNLRAEMGVKSMKRLIRNNLGPNGDLDNDGFSRAILSYRNTPDRDTGLSPAQVVFDRVLKDFMLVPKGGYKPRKEWLLLQEVREKALARRHLVDHEAWPRTTHPLVPLMPGTIVSVQNQRGPNKTKWDNSGMVVESLPHSQYKVKLGGTGRVRAFLRKIVPYGVMVEDQEGPCKMELSRSPGVQEGPVGTLHPKAGMSTQDWGGSSAAPPLQVPGSSRDMERS